MFVVRKESGWNMISKAMKYRTTITYGWLGEATMGHMKSFLSKGRSLMRGEVG